MKRLTLPCLVSAVIMASLSLAETFTEDKQVPPELTVQGQHVYSALGWMNRTAANGYA